MSKPINTTLLGGFVLGAVALLVVAVGVLGSGKLFAKKYTYVMVFDGSVKGLSVGAPVVFRGAPIGSVSNIRMQFDNKTNVMAILVYAELEQGKVNVVNLDGDLARELKKRGGQYGMVKEFIGRGLRAQLESQSLLTGKLQIALDLHGDKPAVYAGLDKKISEIPTIPTPLQELAKKLENLPLEEIFTKIGSAADGIAKLSRSLDPSVANLNTTLKDMQSLLRNLDAQVKPLSAGLSQTIGNAHKLLGNLDRQVASLGASMQATLGDAGKLVRNVDGRIDPLFAGLRDVIQRAEGAMKQAESTLAELEGSTEGNSVLMVRLIDTLGEFEKAAFAVRGLADYLEKNPEALLRGKRNR